MKKKTARTEIALRIIFILLIILTFATSNAQTKVKTDRDGNFIAVRDTATRSSDNATPTGKTYTDTKGIKYPVYISAKGKYFIRRISKTGNQYNQYLKIN